MTRLCLTIPRGATGEVSDAELAAAFSRDHDTYLSEVSWPMVGAHRTGWSEFGDSTAWAAARAIDAGCRVIDADFRWTSDGEAVLMHDETVDRTTNGTGAVASLTAAQLAAVRVDPAVMLKASGYAEQPVPTLWEFLERFRGRAIIAVEHKVMDGARIPSMAAEMRAAGCRDYVLISTVSMELATAWANQGFQSALVSVADVDHAALVAAGVRWVHYQFTGTGTAGEIARIAAAKAAGLMVGTWTHTRLLEVEAAIAAGSDLPLSDYPGHATKATRATVASFAANRLPVGFFPSDATFAVSGGYLTEAAGGSEFNFLCGALGPIVDEDFTATATFKASSTAVGALWGGLYLTGPSDAGFKTAGMGAYFALLKFAGGIDFYRVSGGTSTLLGNIAGGGALTPALVAGVEYTVALRITPTHVIASRVDTGASVTVADTTYRHARWWPHWARSAGASGLMSVAQMGVTAT